MCPSRLRTRVALIRILQCLLLLLLTPFALAQTHSFTVVTSIRPIALLTQDLTQNLPVTVTTLLPPNADPHSWALRISDRQQLEDADLILWLGPDFETFLAKPLAASRARHLRLGDLPDLQWTSAKAHDHDHAQHTGRDLHIWLNPANAAVILKVLTAKLVEQRPDWQSVLQQRLLQQVEQLEQAQADIHKRLLPHQEKGFIAYHDTYGHFVQAFGLHPLGAVNQSSEQQLSAKSLRKLQAQARSASCLMAEKNGEQEQRIAQTLKLPLMVADGLAADAQIGSFAEFLLRVSVGFERCFMSAERASSGNSVGF